MGSKLKNIGLIGLGLVAGVAASMQFAALAQKNAGSPLPLDELRQLADVFGLIKSDYVEPVEDKKLLTEAISGMVASLDPHSAYLDKKAFKELREGTQGKFVGLGIEVGMEDGYVKVISPIEDSPAYRAGIKAGDLITRLDTTPVKGMTLDEAVKRMRGEPNTKITLTIARKDEDKPLGRHHHAPGNPGPERQGEDGRARLRLAARVAVPGTDRGRHGQEDSARCTPQDPNIKGLVLDLRNDPGGVLPGAIGVVRRLPAEGCGDRLDQRPAGRFEGDLLRRREYYASRSARRSAGETAGGGQESADGGAGQYRFGLGLGNRRRRAAGLQARHRDGHADLRQGLGADDAPAVRRHRGQADHRALLHAERPLDPGQRHRAGPDGRRIPPTATA